MPHDLYDVAPDFLADAIVEYIPRPEYRAAIGTEAEAQRFAAQWMALMAARGRLPAAR